MKAYSVISNLNSKAIDILKSNNIQVVINDSDHIPNMEELINLLQEYNILIIGVKTKVPKEILKHIKSHKVIATLSIGLDHIDKEVRESDMIQVLNVKTANTASVAEHIFALILGLKKRIVEANEISIKGGTKRDLSERSNDISNSSIGIIGAGKISREVIEIAKQKGYVKTDDIVVIAGGASILSTHTEGSQTMNRTIGGVLKI